MEKRIFDESKEKALTDVNLSKGRLIDDTLFVSHHEATEEIKEVSHVEVIAEYPNGGKDIQTIIDIPYQPAQEAWDEYEDIFVYIPYTEAELLAIKEQEYKTAIVSKIREKYSLDDELALARQRDTKPEEYAEYNAYCEACKLEVKNTMSFT